MNLGFVVPENVDGPCVVFSPLREHSVFLTTLGASPVEENQASAPGVVRWCLFRLSMPEPFDMATRPAARCWPSAENDPEYAVCNRCVFAIAEVSAAITEKPPTQPCDCCRFNRTILDLTVPGNLPKWYRLEAAKGRLFCDLSQLGLSYGPRNASWHYGTEGECLLAKQPFRLHLESRQRT